MRGRPLSPTSSAVLAILDANALGMEAQRHIQEAYINLNRMREALRRAAGKIERPSDGPDDRS